MLCIYTLDAWNFYLSVIGSFDIHVDIPRQEGHSGLVAVVIRSDIVHSTSIWDTITKLNKRYVDYDFMTCFREAVSV